MPYVPESPYESPYSLKLIPGSEVNVGFYQDKLAQWHAGEPISLDGGVVIGKIDIPENSDDLLDHLPDSYAQIGIPGSDNLMDLPVRRFRQLTPKAKAIIYGLHAAFRETVRLDALRSGLQPPNATVGGTNIGMFSGEDDWHCDGWMPYKSDDDRHEQLFGNGILRYGFSVGAPGTVLLVGQLRRSQIIDGFLLAKLDHGIEGSGLQRKKHAAGEVIRFVSDYDVHRAPRLKKAVGRYFTTASVLLPLTRASQVKS